MAEELRLDVVSVAHSKGLRDAAADLKATKGEADKLGDSFDKSGHEAFDFGTELEKTRARVKELNEEFRRTGDADVLKDLKKNRSVLNELEKVSREAKRLAPDTKGFLDNFDASQFVSEARGQLILALVAAAVTAAPAMGAIVSGAVAGTAAGAGIIGGVVAASTDNRVKSAFQDMVDSMTAESFGGGAFVQPTLDAIELLKRSFKDLNLGDTLAKGASSVTTLAGGISDMVHNIMPGFNEVMDQAETFTAVFANGLAETGSAVSDFLHSLMSSEGTIEGLNMGFKILSASIIGLGNVLEFLANVFHKTVVVGAALSGFMEDAVADVPVLGAAFRWMNDNMEDVEKTGWGAAGSMKHFDDMLKGPPERVEDLTAKLAALNDEFERNIDLQAQVKIDQIDIEQGLQDLADQFAENGNTLSIFTDEGRENQKALIGMAREMRQLRDDMIAQGFTTESANAVLATNKERLYAQAEAAGVSKAALDALIATLFAVPPVVETSVVVRTITPATVEGRRAAGGPVNPYGTYLVGEKGPELLQMGDSGGYVWPSVGSGGGGGSTRNLVITLQWPDGKVIRQINVDEALARGVPPSTVSGAYP